MWMSFASGLRGHWFKSQTGLQDMSVEGSGINGMEGAGWLEG